jgi:hypothetical protein
MELINIIIILIGLLLFSYLFVVFFNSLKASWQKGAVIGIIISLGISILIFYQISNSFKDWNPKTREDAMAGVGIVLGFIFMLIASLIVITSSTLIGYSFDNKNAKFRILGITFGLLIHPIAIIRNWWNMFDISPLIILIIVFFIIGYFLDKMRARP